MFSNILSALGGPLMGMLGGGGGSSSSPRSGGGGSSLGGLGDIVGSVGKVFAPLMGTAGTALGTYFGGPLGGAVGGALGNAASSMFGGGDQNQQQTQQHQPQQQMQPYAPQQQSYGTQMGTSLGNIMNQGFNQYMPQQLQGQTFGNMGGALGGYLGGQFGHPNAGRAIGEFINPYLRQVIPENMRGQQMGNFGGYLGQQMGQRFDQGMQSRGFNPYGGGYGGVPEAPPFDSDMGQTESGGYGSIPEAPPFDLDMGIRSPSRISGYSNRSQLPGPPQGREAMLSQIRSYQRPSRNVGGGYGNVPEAPPFNPELAPTMGGSGNRFGLRSSAHPGGSGNMFDEIRRRGGTGYMGLRPAQTRASNAYPRDEGSDFFGRMMTQRRNAIEPYERRNYQHSGSI